MVGDRRGLDLVFTFITEHMQEDFTSREVGVVAASYLSQKHSLRFLVDRVLLHDVSFPFISALVATLCLLVVPLIVEATALLASHVYLLVLEHR